MDILRIIFVALHVASAGVWIAQFPAGIIMARLASAAQGPSVGTLNQARGALFQQLGQFGAAGILVSGIILLFVDHLGLFGIGGFTPLWLMIMQGIFVIAMIIVGAFFIPNANKLQQLMAGAKGGPPPAEAVEIQRRLQIGGYILNLLVLINIIVGVWRPQ